MLSFFFRASPTPEKLAEEIAETRSSSASSGSASARIEIKSPEIEVNSRTSGISARRRRSTLEVVAVKAVLVVHLPLFRIGQYVVRFLQLLELFFRGLVSGIQVRVILPRQLAECCADVLRARASRDAQ